MKKIHTGQTENWLPIKILNPQSTTPGRGWTGIRASMGSFNIGFLREGDGPENTVSVEPVDVNTMADWVPGGWYESNAALLTGIYWIGVPDAAFAAGSRRVVVSVNGGKVVGDQVIPFQDVDFEIELDAGIDYQGGIPPVGVSS